MAEMTLSQTAVALGVDVATVRWRIEQGVLQARRTASGRWLVALPEEATGWLMAPSKRRDRVRAVLEEAHQQAGHQVHLIDHLAGTVNQLREQLQDAQREAQATAADLSALRQRLAEAQARSLAGAEDQATLTQARELIERLAKQSWRMDNLLEATAHLQMRLANARDSLQLSDEDLTELPGLLS